MFKNSKKRYSFRQKKSKRQIWTSCLSSFEICNDPFTNHVDFSHLQESEFIYDMLVAGHSVLKSCLQWPTSCASTVRAWISLGEPHSPVSQSPFGYAGRWHGWTGRRGDECFVQLKLLKSVSSLLFSLSLSFLSSSFLFFSFLCTVVCCSFFRL